MDAQILIQAGHDGGRRNQGTGSVATTGAPGIARPEIEMTPIVAEAAFRILDAAGFDVIKENAFYDKRYEVDLAVSLHFDGSGTPCASGRSIGYPAGVPAGSNKPTADLWREIYGQYWPVDFNSMPDNFTGNLSGYYGYAWTSTNIAEILIEFGEISCPRQDEWLQPRVGDGPHDSWLGRLVAHFCAEVILGTGQTAVPDPGPFEVDDNVVGRLLDRLDFLSSRETQVRDRLRKLLGE